MPMVTESAQTKLTETPLEPIGPLDTKVVQCLVSYFYISSSYNSNNILAKNDRRLSCSCLYGYSKSFWYEINKNKKNAL